MLLVTIASSQATLPIMINAVLVFNNNGQPRLTKFYTQLVRIFVSVSTTTMPLTNNLYRTRQSNSVS